jgi:hypothetical protein
MQAVHQAISPDIYLQLLQWREKLSAYQTVSCKLMHEQVTQLNEDSITADIDLDQLRVIRKGFCNASLRRRSLGCAHTMANDMFVRLVISVYETGILQTTSSPSVINDLVLKIYLIDHEKGRIEKRKALVQLQKDSQELINIQNALLDIISRHQNAIDELEKVRQDIMHQLDKVIANYQTDMFSK